MGGLNGECVYLPLTGCLNKTKKRKGDSHLYTPMYILHLLSSDVRTPDYLCLVPSTRHDGTCL